MPEAVIHPTPQELNAFGLGKLPEHAAAAVAAHLETCPACRQVVASVMPDSFLDKLRAAKPDGSSFPPGLARPGNAPDNAGRPAIPNVPCPAVPPELARHPKYLILRELGRGGMGVVYQARQTMMNRQVVIKVINRALLEQPGALERFHREIRAAAQLSHPNIVTAYDAEQVGDLHMLVMEFVPGQSLAEVLEKKGPLPVAYACHFMRQVALGLQHAHERGMVHRDIKPSNLMLSLKNQIKILDFGLAKVISERDTSKALTASDAYMGTPDYCAPEQSLDAAKADIRADLYSLGCTLYCLLAGRPPFQEDTAMKTILAHMQKQPQPLTELRPDVPERLWRAVERMLAKEPIRRYQKPKEVALALAPFIKPGSKGGAAPDVGSPVKGTVIETESEIEKVVRKAPAKKPPKEVPAKEEASPFANLVDTPALLRKAEGAKESTKRAPAMWTRLWPMLGAAGLLLLLVLGGMWASGVFTAKVKTTDGILIVEVNEPNSELFVDGERVTVTWHNGGKKAEIRVKPGTHKVELKKDSFSAESKELTFKDGDREIFTARLVPKINEKREANNDKDFVQLFNGKDKKGWITHESQPGDWSVENGILIGRPVEGGSHLYTERGDYKDFHLVMRVRSGGEYNGVWFRAPFGSAVDSCNMSYNAKFAFLWVWPRPWIQVRETSPPLNEWLTFEVIAKGNHLTVITNGTTVAEFFDDKERYRSGHIVLQQHGGKVEYRKIEIKELK